MIAWNGADGLFPNRAFGTFPGEYKNEDHRRYRAEDGVRTHLQRDRGPVRVPEEELAPPRGGALPFPGETILAAEGFLAEAARRWQTGGLHPGEPIASLGAVLCMALENQGSYSSLEDVFGGMAMMAAEMPRRSLGEYVVALEDIVRWARDAWRGGEEGEVLNQFLLGGSEALCALEHHGGRA
jgi:hypothetical protein